MVQFTLDLIQDFILTKTKTFIVMKLLKDIINVCRL
jgi:hypothetical protein